MGNKNLDPSPFFYKKGKNSFIFPILSFKMGKYNTRTLFPLFPILKKKMKKGNNHQSLILTSFAKKN